MSTDPYTLHTLDNGLQIVIEHMPEVRSAAAGFLARTGARDEESRLAGVSHFLEHMMFKGTAKRNWRDITVDFDALGSSYNAFTSEDRTVYYGWVPKKAIGRQIELLADMMRSMIPPEEFDMEKNVILEEIAMAKDNIEHVAFDFLQERLFEGNPLAWPILGYQNTIEPLARDEMWTYFQKRYAPDHMVLLVAGNVDPPEIIGFAEQYCGSWRPSGALETRVQPAIKTGTDVCQIDRFNQQVVILSFPSVSACDQRAETVAAISSLLGGENSRFFWNIVQKGLAPQAGVYQMEYTDCGVLMLYALCKPENSETVVEAMRAEAGKMSTEGATQEEVQRVRNKRKTSLAVECEVPYHRLTQLMDDMEYHGAPRSVEERMREVEDVTVDAIADYLREYPIDSGGHLASVGPRNWPEPAGI